MSKYELKCEYSVYQRLLFAGVKPVDVIAYLSEAIHNAIKCEPNVTHKYRKYEKRQAVTNRAWAIRTFFPGTGVFFKLTIGEIPEADGGPLIVANVREVRYTQSDKCINHRGVLNKGTLFKMNSKDIEDFVGDAILLGQETFNFIPRMPKTMGPKGFKVDKFIRRTNAESE